MPHTPSHRSSRSGEVGHRGNRRSAPNSERGGAPRAPAVSGQPERRGRRRPELPVTGVSGKNAAALCVMFAFLGLGLVAVAEIVSRTNRELINPVFNVLSGAGTLAAVATGVYSQTLQLRHWSRRVKRRLWVGLPVALLTALMVTHNFFARSEPCEAPTPDKPARPAAAEGATEDGALVKPGWYGELQQDRLLLVVTSFEDHAAETRQFCRRLSKPVSYATLSLINLGTLEPVVLRSLEVGLRLDSGEELQSWAVRPLLEQKRDLNGDLLPLLTVPRTLAAGAMLPDIPVCRETNFPWAHVTAVTVNLGSGPLAIPGRLMTEVEKRALLAKATVARPAGATNTTAEAWFKNM